MQKALPRIRSVQYFICEIFGKTFYPKVKLWIETPCLCQSRGLNYSVRFKWLSFFEYTPFAQMHHANMKNISLKLFQNEHDSVKDTWKKGQKTCNVRPKNRPSKGEKWGARKAKEEGRREAKSKSQHCCAVKAFCTKTLFRKNGENFLIFI